jgi:hypothetical protein
LEKKYGHECMIKTLLIFKIHFLKLNVFLVGKEADETTRYYEIL